MYLLNTNLVGKGTRITGNYANPRTVLLEDADIVQPIVQ